MAKPRHRAVGILTGGGDAPGLNAVIRAATKTALERDWQIYGVEDGFDGLLRKKMRRLTRADVRGILALGGTILGTTNRLSPFEYPVKKRHSIEYVDRSYELARNFHGLGLAGLIVVGGDGTLAMAEKFHRRGVPIVGVPKTIDNDIPGTALSFGFDTAVQTAVDALDKLHPTAEAHKRIMVVEVMGRNAGWIALHSGLAGGADVILIPEIPHTIDSVVASIRARERAGREFSIVVVAEGAMPKGGAPATRGPKEPGREVRLGGIAERLAAELGEKLKKETRSLVLGHLQRGGSPSTFDRLLATRLGAAAMRLVDEGLFGNMVALKPPTVAAIPLHQAVGKVHRVPLDSDILQSARDLGIGFGD
jgi:ATP-dependent phosphofructokinase / diphosphate-dependent phosphofructokinase